MHAAVRADGPAAAEHLRSLDGWLAGTQELRGRVSRNEAPPPPGVLGPVLDALTVALAPGTATAFATAVIAWLRSRRGEVRIRVTLSGDRSVELTARRVAGLDAEALQRQVAQLAALLAEDADEREGEHGTGRGDG